MRDSEVSKNLLGLEVPWLFRSVDMDMAQRRVDLEIECSERAVGDAGERLQIQRYAQSW